MTCINLYLVDFAYGIITKSNILVHGSIKSCNTKSIVDVMDIVWAVINPVNNTSFRSQMIQKFDGYYTYLKTGEILTSSKDLIKQCRGNKCLSLL